MVKERVKVFNYVNCMHKMLQSSFVGHMHMHLLQPD